MEPDIVARVPPIPLPDESCEAVYCSHLLEHLESDEASALIAEVWRVLTVGGEVEFCTPYALSPMAFQDPTHRSYWVPERFAYYTNKYAYLAYGLETRFELVTLGMVAWEVQATMRKVSA